jgi:hypothetical protein
LFVSTRGGQSAAVIVNVSLTRATFWSQGGKLRRPIVNRHG